jgi:DNA polymerase
MLKNLENDATQYGIILDENFTVEDLGIVEDYVYDIEVQNTHSFFANDILVHNSIYYSVEKFVKRKFGENADASTPGIIDWVDSFEKKVIQQVIQETTEEYAEILNIVDPSQIGVEREIISDRAFFVAKKRYAARVLDMEGVRFSLDDPYIKAMGLEIARSSTPAWVKKKLQESIEVILDNDQYGVRKWRDETKLQYQDQPLEDICAVQGVSSLDYNINDKGIPQGSKAAIAHNNWVKQQGLEDTIELLQPGEKYKRCYLLTPNRFGTEIISFGDSKIAKIIEEDGIFDYQTNFQKQFEQPLERMVESMNYDIRDVPVFGSLDDW